MAHLYKLVQNMNENMVKCYQKWFARPVYTETINLMDIAELIQRNSTAKKSDAYAVLVEMVEVVSDALKASKRVHIDGFGTFKIGISSKGAETPADFNANENIRSCRVLFQPEVTTDPSTHKRIKKMIQGMTYQSAASLVSAKEIEERGKEEEPEP
ncbi:MAG: HU family DNA-binding protein [Prevotella sp.]|nr:HU family DNA-binding protein [Prevotella sp.]